MKTRRITDEDLKKLPLECVGQLTGHRYVVVDRRDDAFLIEFFYGSGKFEKWNSMSKYWTVTNLRVEGEEKPKLFFWELHLKSGDVIRSRYAIDENGIMGDGAEYALWNSSLKRFKLDEVKS